MLLRAAVLGLMTICLGTSCSAEPQSAATRAETPAEVAQDLRAELLKMQRDDQAERTGEGLPPGSKLPPAQDYARVVRLKELIEEQGWPVHSLVGEDGASAAWLVAQHADFDVDFQEQALSLMREAAALGEVDETEVAYLADRVAVNRGVPQTYGSQIRCRDGRPRPATPIDDRPTVDDRRLAVGMDTLKEYYGELSMMCADEAAQGQQSGP